MCMATAEGLWTGTFRNLFCSFCYKQLTNVLLILQHSNESLSHHTVHVRKCNGIYDYVALHCVYVVLQLHCIALCIVDRF